MTRTTTTTIPIVGLLLVLSITTIMFLLEIRFAGFNSHHDHDHDMTITDLISTDPTIKEFLNIHESEKEVLRRILYEEEPTTTEEEAVPTEVVVENEEVEAAEKTADTDTSDTSSGGGLEEEEQQGSGGDDGESGFLVAGKRCQLSSECNGVLECQDWGFGQRCLPVRTCLFQQYRAFTQQYDLTALHDQFMSLARTNPETGEEEESIITARAILSAAAGLRGGGRLGRKSTSPGLFNKIRNAFHEVYDVPFQDLRRVPYACGVVTQDPNLKTTTTSSASSTGEAEVNGFHIEAGMILDASYTDMEWKGNNEIRQLYRICAGGEMGKIGVEVAAFNSFVTTGGVDALQGGSVMLDIDYGFVPGISIAAGIGFKGGENFRWDTTVALPGGAITPTNVGSGRITGMGICRTCLFNTTTVP